MDLLRFAAETGSMEEWIDLDSHHHPTLIRQAAAIVLADADRGVHVRTHRGMTVLGTLAGMLRPTAPPFADPVLEAPSKARL